MVAVRPLYSMVEFVGDYFGAVHPDWLAAVDEICPIHLIVLLKRPNPNARVYIRERAQVRLCVESTT